MKFEQELERNNAFPMTARRIDILQVNVGYRCNMVCKHCHVMAGPSRTEVMDGDTVDHVLAVLQDGPIGTLDVTGGAPEMNPHFRRLVATAVEMGKHVIVRTNLTIFFEDGMEDIPDFLRAGGVEITASLPYYIEDSVDRVRGSGAFNRCIEALKMLNELGYGRDESLVLNLVYNPQGAFLPPDQCSVEEEYRRELRRRFGIEFSNLYTFTNMPIGRFREYLERSGNMAKYMATLESAFNPSTLDGIMCRFLISVRWDGRLFDCDFNQVIDLPLVDGYPQNISEFRLGVLEKRKIAVGEHCFGCTAGQGST